MVICKKKSIPRHKTLVCVQEHINIVIMDHISATKGAD